MNHFLRVYLPIYLVAYLVLAFVWPTYKTWKATGINPVTFGKADTAHDYIGWVMKCLMALLLLMVIGFCMGSTVYRYVLPIGYLEMPWLQMTGLVLVHLALVWIAIAQYQMQNSWRIGIDEVNKTELRTKGIFSISRNPIFLGMLVSMLGLFLLIPNALGFCLTLLTYFVIQIQIRLEEAFLEKQHGAVYQGYKQRVRRLI
jgi:protein-S-isoprenylcysteine O-methyltransferase Ste14